MTDKRPSPSQHASETKPGTILKGNNRAFWICKEVSGGVKRWVQIPNIPGKSYLTHNNGGSPYKVFVHGRDVAVYEQDGESWDLVWDRYRREPRKKFDRYLSMIYLKKIWEAKKVDRVFVGDYKGKEYRNYPGQKGNSILVRMTSGSYVFIGHRIFRFKPKDVIRAYHSPVGNSDAPYPWAVGDTNTYLMIEKATIPNALLTKPGDPYGEFYREMKHAVIRNLKSLPGFKTIHERAS